ncbi:MAG: LamG domain-containing protein [Verrucomicrobiota bacterium]
MSHHMKILNRILLLSAFVFTQLEADATIVAKWSFDEPSGTIAVDSVGSFNGTLSSSGAGFVAGGISGGALSLNRSGNGFVNMGNVLGLTNGDFSLVAWIKMSAGDQTPDSILLGKHAAFSRNGYFLHINQSSGLAMQSTNKVFFYEGGSGVGQIQRTETPLSTTSVNDGSWHQIVAVYRAGGAKMIYVDGAPAEDTKPSQPFIGNTVAFLIGGVNENGVPRGRLTALVDEVQIYNHSLSDADVDFLYQHPAAVALDCSETVAALQAQLSTANNTIAGLQTQLAASNGQIQELETELFSVDQSLQRLADHFSALFRSPGFQIPGTITPEKAENLVESIVRIPPGAQQAIFFNLTGRKR